jgi:phosphotriesterase-related protein
MTEVNTATGRRDAAELGKTLIHEHVLVGFPGWFLDRRQPAFDRREAIARATDALVQLKSYGVATVVDPCPADLGRDVEIMAEVASRAGINLICAAGMYYEAAGLTYTFAHMEEDAIADIFQAEIEDGVGETGIRPGIVKIATGHGTVTPYEQKILRAAARAAARTGVPVLSHTEKCTCGHDQIDIVTGQGVAPEHFVVGHSDGTDDLGYQLSLAERGVFVGFDRFGIENIVPDDVRMTNLKAMVDRGHRDRVLMSHDYVVCWKGGVPGVPLGASISDVLPNWRMTHIFETILPELTRRGMSTEDIDHILTDNPRRFFSNTQPS